MEATSGDGVRLWWEASGQGAPVLLVPGRGDSTDLFPARFSEPLVDAGHRVIRFDPRDTGLSADGGDGYTMAAMGDDVLAVLDAANAPTAHCVGISMAGLILVDVATRTPERVRSLTLISAASPDPEAGVGEDFFDMMDDDPVGTIVRAMGPTTDADRAWVEDEVEVAGQRAPHRPDAGRRHQEAAYRSSWPTVAQLHQILAPTLVIHGTGDRKLPIRHARAFVEGIPDSELVVMDGMGHLPRPAEWGTIATRVARHIGGAS